ncbi:MAG: hypothetical protein ACRCSU_10650 [Paracoccaceae bacterium]
MAQAVNTAGEVLRDPIIEIVVRGPFAVRAQDGSNLTPKPQKARALLALLALSPDYRRPRAWIMDRLWSDRGPEQASGSLRQALVDLRKALGKHDDILLSDREWIGLRPGSVRTIESDVTGAEFLDGVTVRDPKFRSWLAAQTANRGTATPIGAQVAAQTGANEADGFTQRDALILVGWGATGTPGSSTHVVAEIISSRIARGIAEQVPAATMSLSRDQVLTSGAPDIDVLCSVIEDDGICLALIKVTHFLSGRVLFARDFRFVGSASSLVSGEAVDRAVFEAAEKSAGGIPHVLGARRAVTQSTALSQLALFKMFSFDKTHFAEADNLLVQAYDLHESSVFLAWRGLLQMIKSIEVPQTSQQELRDMAEAMTRYASERSPSNATVNALASQTNAMMFGDAPTALHYATLATSDNPRNPLALQAMAVAKMLAGEDEDSYQLSSRARAYAAQSSFRHWWDAHHTTICVATGRKDEAIEAAESSLRSVSSLRASCRYLIALYADKGDLQKADAMRAKLATLEQGFSLDRMLNDPEYPVRTLRRTGLIQAVRKLI